MMKEELKKLTTDDLKELAKQLRCPSGDKGQEIGLIMEETNASMIHATLDLLNLDQNDTLLELGPGNGYHLEKLTSLCKQVYVIDISKLMIEKIVERYPQDINNGKLITLLGDGTKIDLNDHIIDKGFTVNTLYFWQNPKEYLRNIARCFRENGEFFITFAHKDFMESLPFIEYGFTAYNEDKIKTLCENTPFEIKDLFVKNESITTKTGEQVERKFVIARLIKMYKDN